MITIRAARDADLPVITQIYAHYVEHSTATFEEVPPSVDDMRSRFQSIVNAGLPYVVSVLDTQVTGYAYAAPYRARAAYRYTVENSVYVHPDHLGHGAGRALMAATLQGCLDAGKREVVAVIGGSDNKGSIRLHESLGFIHVGLLHRVGFKFNHWIDTVFMQRSLQE